jgi:Protein of unknown function (DUF3574)
MRAITGIVLALGVAGCAPARAPSCAWMDGAPAVTVQLLFGRTRPGGDVVSDPEWRDFLAAVVTPRFPDGLTVLQGSGQWRSSATGRIATEPSTVVEIVAPRRPDLAWRLQEVRDAYRTRFKQESVGLVTQASCAAF